MYKYEDIAFRATEKSDLEILKQLHNDFSTFSNLATIDLANNLDQEKWWDSLSNNRNDKRYVIVKADQPEFVIGRLRIQNIDRQNQNCEVGMDIMPELRRQGYGRKSYKMLLEFLFLHYNMHMVYLRVVDFNQRGKELYRKIGFNETGHFKEFFYRNGKYWDYFIFCLSKEDYFNNIFNNKVQG
jgi:RimJ/RimL family protein N-acetyltransferase